MMTTNIAVAWLYLTLSCYVLNVNSQRMKPPSQLRNAMKHVYENYNMKGSVSKYVSSKHPNKMKVIVVDDKGPGHHHRHYFHHYPEGVNEHSQNQGYNDENTQGRNNNYNHGHADQHNKNKDYHANSENSELFFAKRPTTENTQEYREKHKRNRNYMNNFNYEIREQFEAHKDYIENLDKDKEVYSPKPSKENPSEYNEKYQTNNNPYKSRFTHQYFYSSNNNPDISDEAKLPKRQNPADEHIREFDPNQNRYTNIMNQHFNDNHKNKRNNRLVSEQKPVNDHTREFDPQQNRYKNAISMHFNDNYKNNRNNRLLSEQKPVNDHTLEKPFNYPDINEQDSFKNNANENPQQYEANRPNSNNEFDDFALQYEMDIAHDSNFGKRLRNPDSKYRSNDEKSFSRHQGSAKNEAVKSFTGVDETSVHKGFTFERIPTSTQYDNGPFYRELNNFRKKNENNSVNFFKNVNLIPLNGFQVSIPTLGNK